MSATDTDLEGTISSIRRFAPAIVSETGLFGIYTLLIIQSTYILLHKDLRARSVQWMLAATCLMYALSTTHWATLISGLRSILRHPQKSGVSLTHTMGIIASASAQSSLLIGDAVVVWRVWTLWGKNRFVLISCSLFFLSTTAMVGVDVYQDATLSPNEQNTLAYVDGIYFGTTAVVAFTLSLATNLWSTALIAYKAWEYRSNISANMMHDSRKNMVEKVFTLLLESGILYSSLQVVWLTALVFWDSTLKGNFTLIMPAIIPQISGIYPTTIIVLVCLQKTHCDRQFTYIDFDLAGGAQHGHPRQTLSVFEAHRPATVGSPEPIVIIGRTKTAGPSESDSQSSSDRVEVKSEV